MKLHQSISQGRTLIVVVVVAGLVLGGMLTELVLAHCDSMDGPVVKDAQRALSEKKVDPVLKWIPAKDEAGIRKTFETTLVARAQGEEARQVADAHFFDTLVRVHRASEGEGFTGIKPAGSAEPAFTETDRALADGQIDELADKYAAAVREGIKRRFDNARAKRQSAEKSPEAGREYVAAYVELTHFVENLEHLVKEGPSHQHRVEGQAEHAGQAGHEAH
jgi:hypothetical protein